MKSKKQPSAARAMPASAGKPLSPSPGATSRRKAWFRVIALGVPLLSLVLIEFILRAVGFGYPTGYFLKSETNGVRIFIENQQFSRRYFPPGLERTPQPLVIPTAKAPDTIRIFIFGESAAMGDPEPAFGFGRILEVMLRDALPGKHIEVINVAVTAINSHVIREIAKDCTDKQGDFWLVYMGNNEVVGPFGAGTIFGDQVPGLAFIRANLALKSLRIGQLLDAVRQKVFARSRAPKTWEGMEMFLQQQVTQDDPRMAKAYAHFATNLRDIIRLGQESGARVLVGSVPVNLQDCPPFASRHRAGLDNAQHHEWDRLFKAGIAREQSGDAASAWTNYQQAAKVDDRFAELWFRIGRCQVALGATNEAQVSFKRALDLDTLRFRADSRLEELMADAVTGDGLAGVTRVEVANALAEKSRAGLIGEDLLYEHVHPNFAGNYLIARAYAEQILGPGTNRPPLPTADECAWRLAFTDFNRYQVLDEVRQRLQQPPFTQQLDYATRDARLKKQLDSWQRASLTNAFHIYEQAIALTPGDWMVRENFAKLLQDFNEPQRAEAQWRAVIRILPHYEQAYYSLANHLDAQGQPAEAVKYFQLALRRRPQSFEARNGLGLALANLGQADAAIGQYEEALRLKPDFAEARVNLGQALAQRGKPDEAMAQYLEALRTDSNNIAARVNLGKLKAAAGNVAEAVAQYEAVLRLKPDHAVAHYNLANALSASGAGDRALSHYAEAARHNPSLVEARYNLGLGLAKAGDNEGALAQFTEVIRLKPGWADGHFNYGVALAKGRRFDEAVEQFQQTLRLQPDNAQARRFLEQAEALNSQKP